MNRRILRCALAIIGLVQISLVPLRGQSPSPKYKEETTPVGKMYVIEGSEHPEEIPEHAYWRHCFHKLANIKKLKATEQLEALGLSPEELGLVFKIAAAQDARDRDCMTSITNRQDDLKAQHASEEAINQAFFDVTIECRYKDLAARDQLLDALSPDAREQLMTWVQNTRRRMTLHVPVSELDFFKRPQ